MIQQNSGDHKVPVSDFTIRDIWYSKRKLADVENNVQIPFAFSSEVLIFKCCYANWEIQLVHEIPAIFITPAHLLFENSKPQLLCAFGTRNDGFLLVVTSLPSWLILLIGSFSNDDGDGGDDAG